MNKIVLAFILGVMSISMCAHAKQKKKRQRVVATNMFEKRHASLVRGLWNYAKWCTGLGTVGLGVVILPTALDAAFPEMGTIPLYESIFVLLIPTICMYTGYKIIKNSYNSMRDEYIESYFGISKPSQMRYSCDL